LQTLADELVISTELVDTVQVTAVFANA